MLEELRDLSVVVQGPVVGGRRDPEERQLTRRCLASIRSCLPDAQIILSTWRGSDLAGLPFDVLVENDDPGPIYQWPFHPSDWFFFGETQDVLEIWNIPLAPEPDFTNWFVSRPRPPNDQWPSHMSRYVPEQYIWLSFLRKHREVSCEYQWDLSAETILNTEKSLSGNLVLISPRQAQLSFAKYATHTGWRDWVYGPGSCYNYLLWRHLYAKHCLNRRYSIFSLAQLTSKSLRRAASAARIVTKVEARFARLNRRLWNPNLDH